MTIELWREIFDAAPATPITADELARARAWSQTCNDPEKLREGFDRIADELARRITKEQIVLKYFAESENEVRALRGLVNRLTNRESA